MAEILDFPGTDEELLQGFLANNPGAIRTVTRWVRGVVHCRYHFTTDQADDLTMESMLHVVQTCGQPGFRIRTEFKSLVRVIATRRCMAAINPRYSEMPMENEQLEFNSPGIEPETGDLAQEQAAEMLRAALERISFVCQRILELRFFKRMKIRQIAADLDRSEGTVKANLHRCLKDARAILEPRLKEENLSCHDLFQE